MLVNSRTGRRIYEKGDSAMLGSDAVEILRPLTNTAGYEVVVTERAARSHRQVGDVIPTDQVR